MKDRSTIDIVVLTFTFLISAVLVILILGSVIGKLLHPELELANVTEAVTLMISNIVGALVGFIGGRATGRMEEAKAANGT